MEVEVLGYAVEIDTAVVAASEAEIERQVREYAAGERTAFDLGVSPPDGFVGDVLRALCAIPYGETQTYGALAAALDTAPRAVGQGCARNPVPVVVPCHRVTRVDGSVGGYLYPGLKERLLRLEADGV